MWGKISQRGPSPWADLIEFLPDEVTREALDANHADLLLRFGSKVAVVEVKLGHLMSTAQQEKYEALTSRPDLYLAALSADVVRLASDSDRWTFLSLTELVCNWEKSGDRVARFLATEVGGILRTSDQTIS